MFLHFFQVIQEFGYASGCVSWTWICSCWSSSSWQSKLKICPVRLRLGRLGPRFGLTLRFRGFLKKCWVSKKPPKNHPSHQIVLVLNHLIFGERIQETPYFDISCTAGNAKVQEAQCTNSVDEERIRHAIAGFEHDVDINVPWICCWNHVFSKHWRTHQICWEYDLYLNKVPWIKITIWRHICPGSITRFPHELLNVCKSNDRCSSLVISTSCCSVKDVHMSWPFNPTCVPIQLLVIQSTSLHGYILI